jgi:hypothetical protein
MFFWDTYLWGIVKIERVLPEDADIFHESSPGDGDTEGIRAETVGEAVADVHCD